MPNEQELCDGIDNNCNGLIDEGLEQTDFYEDVDGDGYGDPDALLLACLKPYGYADNADDCDDSDEDISPDGQEVCDSADNDCDGLTDDDDSDVDTDTHETFYADADADGYGDASDTADACAAPSGYVADATDCDDAATGVNPGAAEVCDTIDNDCDGATDETGSTIWYTDADGDGFGDPSRTTQSCTQPAGAVATAGDCDDSDAAISPAAAEVCDSVDNDCDGAIDDADGDVDASTGSTFYADADGDGYGTGAATRACVQPAGSALVGGDCNDSRASISPAAAEVCDSVDNDCDGAIDDADSGVDTSTGATFYADVDGDGYGDASDSTEACGQPAGHVAGSDDCDDTDADISPAADEVCDGADNDCDGDIDESGADGESSWYADADGDGYGDSRDSASACGRPDGFVSDDSDCDDTDADINPAADEVCDSVDNDCDGDIDEGVLETFYADDDVDSYGDPADTTAACEAPDGYTDNSEDCDDQDADAWPGAPELCNNADDDCDGVTDEGLPDTDGSSVADCKEVAVVISYAGSTSSRRYTCEGRNAADRELDEMEDALSEMGLGMVTIIEGNKDGVTYEEIEPYPVVIYHTFGWSSPGDVVTAQTIAAAADEGKGVIFMGDDISYHAGKFVRYKGDSSLSDAMAMDTSRNNGSRGVGTERANTTHPVIDGSWGEVSGFPYVADIDEAITEGRGEEHLMYLKNSAYPAVWVEEYGGQRTVTMVVGLYTSHDCPLSDEDGLDDIRALFQNAVTWAGEY